MPAQLMEFAPPGPQRRPGVPRRQASPGLHFWKTASGGSQPEPSFLSRLKAAPGLRFNAFRGGNAEGRSVAENRLVSVTITATGHVSQFGYDGMGRRVEIQELDPDSTQTLQVTSDKKYLWDGTEIAEERDTTGGIVLRRFYSQGFVDSDGTALFYTRDHLGSIRELTDGTQAIRARYDYDPWGRPTQLQGDRTAPFQYAGYFWHAPSQLSLTWYRGYDSNQGRWISRDPMAEGGGTNLYQYVFNNVTNHTDILGLCPCNGNNYDDCIKNAARRWRIRDYDINKMYPDIPEDPADWIGLDPSTWFSPGGPNVSWGAFSTTVGEFMGAVGFIGSLGSWGQHMSNSFNNWANRNAQNEVTRNRLLTESHNQFERDAKACARDCGF